MGNNPLYTLLKKYRAGLCTPEELAELDKWYGQFNAEAEGLPGIPQGKLDQLLGQVKKKIRKEKPHYQILRKTLKYAAGIAILLMMGWGSMYYLRTWPGTEKIITSESEVIITPGKYQAELTMADGLKVILDSNTVVKDPNGFLIKADSSLVLNYTLAGSLRVPTGENTITVPVGGEYGVVLSDGTRVWLNSGSVLKYPVAFSGEGREVSLVGEGYFQVTKLGVPFVVRTEGMDIRVLGTSFNVSAYPEDKYTTATLVEGKVCVQTETGRAEYEISPGHVLSYEKDIRQVEIKQCDTDLYTSWMNGRFRFRDMRLEDIMIKLKRWYNCEFFYQNPELKDLRFSGAAEKDQPVRYLLEMISIVTDVHFDVKGHTVVLRQK